MLSRYSKSRFWLALLALTHLCGCEKPAVSPVPAAPSGPPNVLVVTLDTCRDDRLGCYGYGLARTPTLDALAADGVRCADATTTAPITLPAHASILTGLLPPTHGVRDNGAYALGDDVTTLAERLKEAGYATQAFVSAVVLGKRYNLTQGFDGYDDDLWDEDKPPMFMIRDRAAPRTAERVVAWLDSWRDESERRPFFAWVHFFDPHQPYEGRPRDRHLCPTAYDAEIAQADDGLEMIVDWLKAHSMLEQTLVVVVGDHGESLGEHGEKTHAIFIYDATVRVPLIWRYPALLPRGQVYDAPVRVIDIVPTILAALDLPGRDETQGENLLDAFQGNVAPPELSQYCESLLAEVGFGMAPLYGVRSEGYKYIRVPRPELYDLKADPRELTNLYDSQRAVADRLDDVLQGILDAAGEAALGVAENPMDAETLEMLQALGYLADSTGRHAMGGVDPKDGIRIYAKLEDARHLARARRWAESERLLREIVAEVPGHVSARNVLALTCLRQGRPEDAEKEYAESLAIDPRQYRALHMLGHLHLMRGELDEAERLHRQCLELAPGFVEGWVHLGFVEAQGGRIEEANAWFEKALTAEPGSPRARQEIADLYFMKEDYPNARAHYEQVLEVTPHHFTAMIQAGVSAARLGDSEAAAAFYRRAEEIRPDSWIPAFNRACIQALAGDPTAALDSLGKAVERCGKPAKMAALLRDDADLDSLRSLEGFKALSGKLGQTVESSGAAEGSPESSRTGDPER